MLAILKRRAKEDQQAQEALALLDTRSALNDLQIVNICKTLCFRPEVVEATSQVYKHARSMELHRTPLKNRPVVASCIFIGCRNANEPRTIKEICAVTQCTIKEVFKCYSIISKKCSLIYNVGCLVESHIIQICQKLDISYTKQKVAVQIATEALNSPDISGRHPRSIATATIYVLCQRCSIPMTFTKLLESSGTNPSTIKTVANLIEKCTGRVNTFCANVNVYGQAEQQLPSAFDFVREA